MLTCQNGYVARAGKKGRGVFAKKALRAGETVEVSPYIDLPPSDFNRIGDSVIHAYRYEVDKKRCALGLGLTSLYNHSDKPNADFYIHAKRKTITIKTIEAVAQDEELTINYGYDVQF